MEMVCPKCNGAGYIIVEKLMQATTKDGSHSLGISAPTQETCTSCGGTRFIDGNSR